MESLPTKKLAAYGLAVLFALAFVGFVPSASAAGAQVLVKVDRSVVKSGQTFRVTASANVRCEWLVQWNGERRVQTGKRFTAAFTAPAVDALQRLPVQATCYWTAKRIPAGTATALGGTTERMTVYVPERKAGTVVVTVLPPGQVSPPKPPHGVPGAPGGVPNTGGPDWWLLLTGTATLAGGVILVRRAARRTEH